MPCHATPRHAKPRHAMPCHAMPCHAMPCHAMPCHAMPCQYNRVLYTIVIPLLYVKLSRQYSGHLGMQLFAGTRRNMPSATQPPQLIDLVSQLVHPPFPRAWICILFPLHPGPGIDGYPLANRKARHRWLLGTQSEIEMKMRFDRLSVDYDTRGLDRGGGGVGCWPLNRYVGKFKFSPTWSCVSLPRATTSSGWKILIFV